MPSTNFLQLYPDYTYVCISILHQFRFPRFICKCSNLLRNCKLLPSPWNYAVSKEKTVHKICSHNTCICIYFILIVPKGERVTVVNILHSYWKCILKFTSVPWLIYDHYYYSTTIFFFFFNIQKTTKINCFIFLI